MTFEPPSRRPPPFPAELLNRPKPRGFANAETHIQRIRANAEEIFTQYGDDLDSVIATLDRTKLEAWTAALKRIDGCLEAGSVDDARAFIRRSLMFAQRRLGET